jgi:hypothetical protein
LSFAEIGEHMGLSRDQVQLIYDKAMQKLRAVDPVVVEGLLAAIDYRRQEIVRRESYGVVL